MNGDNPDWTFEGYVVLIFILPTNRETDASPNFDQSKMGGVLLGLFLAGLALSRGIYYTG